MAMASGLTRACEADSLDDRGGRWPDLKVRPHGRIARWGRRAGRPRRERRAFSRCPPHSDPCDTSRRAVAGLVVTSKVSTRSNGLTGCASGTRVACRSGSDKLRHRHVLQDQRGLEQRVTLGAARHARRFDDLFERDVLVRERGGDRFARPLDRRVERRVLRGAHPERQRAGEQADEVFPLRPVAVRQRRADHQIVLTRHARQRRVERGEEDHEHAWRCATRPGARGRG